MSTPLRTTARTTARRHAERARTDRAEAEAVLDEAYVAHVGFAVDGQPRVLPMTYGRGHPPGPPPHPDPPALTTAPHPQSTLRHTARWRGSATSTGAAHQ